MQPFPESGALLDTKIQQHYYGMKYKEEEETSEEGEGETSEEGEREGDIFFLYIYIY